MAIAAALRVARAPATAASMRLEHAVLCTRPRAVISPRLQARHAHHSKQPTSAETHAMLDSLRATLADPQATERLSQLLSTSTTQSLSRTLSAVKRQQQVESAAAVQCGAQSAAAEQATITFQELKYVALQQGLPFIGFGFVDNAIMIIAGDYIDLKLGVSLGISSMAAAGLGNTISDIAGLGLGGVVEDLCARLGMPTPSLTPAQMMLKETRIAKVVGSSVGVTIGCLLGMCPLLFIETRGGNDREEAVVQVA